jgi:hypothetical protein
MARGRAWRCFLSGIKESLLSYCDTRCASHIRRTSKIAWESAMTPEDRQLISGLFDRMREFGSLEKDGDAETLIRQSVQQNPDAPYMLVQSVLVQEHALQQADARIRQLEQQLQDAESQRAPASSGGFLGGLFGGGNTAPPRPQMNRGSVPPAGDRSGPIGAPARGPGPGGQPLQAGAQQQPGGGGSFLQSAMATAAGVAGGMLLANGISSMLGGGSSAQAAGTTDAGAQQASHDNNASSGEDANLQDASHDDDSSDWGGGDWGGGDMDLDI